MVRFEFTATPVVNIRPVQSGKGYLITGEEAEAFCWKNETRMMHLLSALAVWVDSKQGYKLELVKDPKGKNGFEIKKLVDAKNKPIAATWYFLGNGYSCDESEHENPYL